MTKQQIVISKRASTAARCARRILFSLPAHETRGREGRILFRLYRRELRSDGENGPFKY